jgi:hypothetical protein
MKVQDEIWKKGIKNVHLYGRLNSLDLTRKYDLILIDNAGDRTPIMKLVTEMDIKDSIIVIDNYYQYNMFVSGSAKVECYDDEHWNGKGTMIIFPDNE